MPNTFDKSPTGRPAAMGAEEAPPLVKEHKEHLVDPDRWLKAISPNWFTTRNRAAMESFIADAMKRASPDKEMHTSHAIEEFDDPDGSVGYCCVGLWHSERDFQQARVPVGTVWVALEGNGASVASRKSLVIGYSYFPEAQKTIRDAARELSGLFEGGREEFGKIMGKFGARKVGLGRLDELDKEWYENAWLNTKRGMEAKGLKIKEPPLELGKRIRGMLMEHLTSGPVIALVLEGNDAIASVRKLCGAPSPNRADPATVRGTFSTDSYEAADKGGRTTRSIMHASDSVKTANREIPIWFAKKELLDYKRPDESLIY